MTSERRMQIEREITRAFIEAAIKQGWMLCNVTNGEGETRVSTVDDAMKYAFECDEAHIFFCTKGALLYSWVYIVLGNSGWDVISDYTTDMDKVMEAIDPLITKYEEECQ